MMYKKELSDIERGVISQEIRFAKSSDPPKSKP